MPCSLPRGDHSPQCHFVFFQLPPELLCRLLYRPSTQPQPGRVRTYPSLPAAAAAARPAQILHVIPHAACLCDLSTAGSDPGSTTRGLEQAGACLLGPPRQRRQQHGKRRPQQTCTPVDIILQPASVTVVWLIDSHRQHGTPSGRVAEPQRKAARSLSLESIETGRACYITELCRVSVWHAGL